MFSAKDAGAMLVAFYQSAFREGRDVGYEEGYRVGFDNAEENSAVEDYEQEVRELTEDRDDWEHEAETWKERAMALGWVEDPVEDDAEDENW